MIEDILKKIRKIEIKSKSISNDFFSGAYHTAFKGKGMSFSEVREYSPGDDVRAIDWNVTARLRTPFVKLFHEERELTMMLVIDVSASNFWGSHYASKMELIAELSAVLSFSAQNNNDKIGVIFFSDKIEKFIPPQKGKSHILRIIKDVITFQPKPHHHTNIDVALSYLYKVIKKKSIVFLLSDFMALLDSKNISINSRKHDLIGIHLADKGEYNMPNVGIIKVRDAETGKDFWIDTSDKTQQIILGDTFEKNLQQVESVFNKNKASFIKINTSTDYIKALQVFFSSRRGNR